VTALAVEARAVAMAGAAAADAAAYSAAATADAAVTLDAAAADAAAYSAAATADAAAYSAAATADAAVTLDAAAYSAAATADAAAVAAPAMAETALAMEPLATQPVAAGLLVSEAGRRANAAPWCATFRSPGNVAHQGCGTALVEPSDQRARRTFVHLSASPSNSRSSARSGANRVRALSCAWYTKARSHLGL
jgi:hypothetical protein